MNKFTELYKTISDTELIRIILDQKDYESDAVETAKKEIEFRKLSEEAIEIEILKLEEERKARSGKDPLSINYIEKIKAFLTGIFESINPVQKEIQTSERISRSLIIVMSLIFLFNLFSQFYYFKLLITFSFVDLHFYGLIFLISFISLPVAVYFLWKRKVIGWMLSVIFISQAIIAKLSGMLTDYVFVEDYGTHDDGVFALIDVMFYRIPLTTYISGLLFFGVIFYAFSKKSVRELFKIDLTKFLGSVGLGMLLAYLSFISL